MKTFLLLSEAFCLDAELSVIHAISASFPSDGNKNSTSMACQCPFVCISMRSREEPTETSSMNLMKCRPEC